MRLLAAALLALFGIAHAEDAKPATAAEELKKLEGFWKVIALEGELGKAPPEAIEEMSWTFNGDQLSGRNRVAEAPQKLGTVKLDPSKSPKQIDLTPPADAPAGINLAHGIYKLVGDKLTVCIGDAKAKGRPTEFKASADGSIGLMVLERVKK